MDVAPNDELYVDWITKWRLWKKAWCESDDPVVQFYVQLISKDGVYTATHHAELADGLAKSIGPPTIDQNGVIEIRNGAVVLPTIYTTTNAINRCQDRLGIVTLKLSFFSRPEILKVVLVLEDIGHGVLHDNGRVVSSRYANSIETPRKMPWRDDPVWAIIVRELGPTK